MSGFLKCRFKIYKYLIHNRRNLLKPKLKTPFKKLKFLRYRMDGVVDFFGSKSSSGIVKLLNLYSRLLYNIYLKRLKKLKVF